MKNFTVRNVLVVFISLAMVHAVAASASIGIASAKGSFRVDDSYVAGNATLFEGAAVETGSNPGELKLSHTRVVMATETRSRVFENRLILDRGRVAWAGASFRTVADDLQIVGADRSSKASVKRYGETVEVASLGGTLNILSDKGEMLMTIAPGDAYEFTPDPDQQGATAKEGAKEGAKKAGKVANKVKTAGKFMTVLKASAPMISTVSSVAGLGVAVGTAATASR